MQPASRSRCALLLGLSALALSASATLAPLSQESGSPARRVAVTIDDLPVNEFRGDLESWRDITARLLDGLMRNGVPAIGFSNEQKLYVDGELDADRVALLEAWLEAGLELGNHSYSHPDLHRTPLAEFQQDVLRGEIVTRRLLEQRGGVPRFFRHPFLHTGLDLETRDGLHAFLAEHGYRVAPVTIDNHEWIYARAYDHEHYRGDDTARARVGAAYIDYMERVVAYYEQQSTALLGYELPQTLLIHANRLAADTIDDLIGMLRSRGYELIPLHEALRDPAYTSRDEFTGRGGITWLHRWALTAGKRGEFFAGEPAAHDFVQASFDDIPPAR